MTQKGTTMTVPRPVLLGLGIILALALAACGGSDVAGGSDAADAPADGHGDHAAPETVAEPVDGAPQVDVTAIDIDFEPATLQLDAGEPVNVTVTNDGDALHDFTLEAAGVHVNVEPGASETTGVTVDEPGTYQAICTVPGHEEAGMVIDVEVR